MAKTGRPAKPSYQWQLTEIPISSIKGNHPDLILQSNAITNLEYLLRDLDLVRPDALGPLLHLHPIAITKLNREYFCVAGMRSLQLARACLDKKATVPVLLLTGTSEEDIQYLGQLDVYLTNFLFALRPDDGDKQLTSLWQTVDRNIRKRLTPTLSNKEKFAAAIKTDRRYFSRKRR
jgi:hypothetical protein